MASPPGELAGDEVEEVGQCPHSSDSEQEHPALLRWTPSSDSEPEPPTPPSPPATSSASAETVDEAAPWWPGWPGASVFRLVVAGEKVAGLIGRRGGTIRRLCDETRARVRVLDATDGVTSRTVMISATEETRAEMSPAMDAVIKIFKHVNEIELINPDVTLSDSAPEICSARLLVPKSQAMYLIGKQASPFKSIQETTGATIRVIDKDELLSYGMVDEKIVEIHGASLKVLNALKSVLGCLRKFLVDHGALHLFERKMNQAAVAQAHDGSKENQADYALVQLNQDLPLSCHRIPPNPRGSRYLSYGRDPSVDDPYSSYTNNLTDPLITKVTQTMQIPLLQAEEIIGVGGQNIDFIRSASGAVVVLEETRDDPNEVLVMIQGSSSRVQRAHQLLQFMEADEALHAGDPIGHRTTAPAAAPAATASGEEEKLRGETQPPAPSLVTAERYVVLPAVTGSSTGSSRTWRCSCGLAGEPAGEPPMDMPSSVHASSQGTPEQKK